MLADTLAFTACLPVNMALYTQLPVFKRTYDLLIELVRTAVALQRVYKYTFGERLQQEAMDLVLDIYKANTARDKFVFLASARERLETIRLLVRLLHDIKQITPKRFLFLNIIIEDISKQLTGWQKVDKSPETPKDTKVGYFANSGRYINHDKK